MFNYKKAFSRIVLLFGFALLFNSCFLFRKCGDCPSFSKKNINQNSVLAVQKSLNTNQ